MLLYVEIASLEGYIDTLAFHIQVPRHKDIPIKFQKKMYNLNKKKVFLMNLLVSNLGSGQTSEIFQATWENLAATDASNPMDMFETL